MQEITEKRTLTSKTFQDGESFVTEIYPAPAHYHDGETWQDINPAFELELGFGYKSKHNRHHLRFIDTNKALRFGFAPGVYIDYTLPKSPLFDGNSAVITEAWENTDIQYLNGTKGIKSDIILKELGHPGSFVFPLSLTGCSAIQVGNELVFTSNGQIIGTIPAPYAIDAEGNRGEVILEFDGENISFIPDIEWLASAVYPVSIDPTTTIQPDATAGKDTYVRDLSPTTNYGTETTIIGGYKNSANWRSFIEFSLSSIPVNQYIKTATLTLYPTPGEAVTTNVYRVTSIWGELTATWNLQPTVAELVASVSSPANTNPVDFNILSLVQDWYNGVLPNYGVCLKNDGVAGQNYFSSDYAVAANRPKLVIEHYTKPTVTITTLNGLIGSPTAISNQVSGMSLSGVYTSSDSINMAYKQRQIYDESDNLIYDSDWVVESKTSGQTVTSTVPDIPLHYGTKYYWRWRAKDANAAISDWSSSGYFLCTLAAPTGLAATDDAAGAQIGLAWTAHTGENLAGYYVYRKKAAESVYAKISGLLTTNSYDDEIAASGVSYNYKVSAIADDGYESAQSLAATDTVTFTKWMINDTEVKLSVPLKIATPRRASNRVKTDGAYEIQDLGLLPKKASFTLRYESLTGLEALLSLFIAGLIIYYRDPQGRTFVGKIISDLNDNQWSNLPTDKFYGDLTFEAVEVIF